MDSLPERIEAAELDCPFCDLAQEPGGKFDEEGLAYHIENYCENYLAALQRFHDDELTRRRARAKEQPNEG